MATPPRRTEPRPRTRRRRPAARLATLALLLALLAALAVVAAGPGYRSGVLSLENAFTLLRTGAYGGLAAAVLALGGLALAWTMTAGSRRGLYRALAALVIGLVVAGVPWSYMRTAGDVPPIHDITTDLDDPPQFLAVRPLRADAPNPAEYGGPEIASQQREAYPELGPLRLELPRDQAFRMALDAAEAMDWEIVGTDQPAGRIEATDQSFWFGFKDDVVIRVRSADGGSGIDVRSTSRVGQSDLGVNAARIRAYLDELAGKSEGA